MIPTHVLDNAFPVLRQNTEADHFVMGFCGDYLTQRLGRGLEGINRVPPVSNGIFAHGRYDIRGGQPRRESLFTDLMNMLTCGGPALVSITSGREAYQDNRVGDSYEVQVYDDSLFKDVEVLCTELEGRSGRKFNVALVA